MTDHMSMSIHTFFPHLVQWSIFFCFTQDKYEYFVVVVTDLEHDGIDEIIVCVSYYFAEAYLGFPWHRLFEVITELCTLDKDVHTNSKNSLDHHKYLASSVVTFDLQARDIKWISQLSITTGWFTISEMSFLMAIKSDEVEERSYLTASPTVIDLDHDGLMEILVSTGCSAFWNFTILMFIERIWSCICSRSHWACLDWSSDFSFSDSWSSTKYPIPTLV